MPEHVLTQIRNAAADRVRAAGLDRVRTSAAMNFLDTELPAALVDTPNDEVEEVTKSKYEPALEKRRVDLVVAVIADGESETITDDLDAIRASIEREMADELGGLAKSMEHTGGERETMADEDGGRWLAVMFLTWSVHVWTAAGTPEVAL